MTNFNDFETKRLNELIEKHDKDKELEIRFSPPDEETFKRVFAEFFKDHAKATATIEQSILIMTETDKSGTDRKEIFFKNGVKTQTEHNRKHREGILSVRSHTRQEIYRVVLSSERPVPEFGMVSAFRIRLKLRCSIVVGDWRYDFTAAIQLEKQQFPQLKQIKGQMFPAKKATPATYLASIPDMPGMRYEMEVEYVGKTASLTIESIGKTVKSFSKYLSSGEEGDFEEQSDYQTAVAELAGKLINDKRVVSMFRSRYGLKQLVNQPRNLTRAIFFNTIVPNIDGYYISDKADGERCLVRISEERVDIILAGKIAEMPMFGKPTEQKGLTLCDAEIVNLDRDDPAKSKHSKLYLFDVLMHNGDNVTTKVFEEREKLMDGIARGLKNVEKKILKRLTKKDYGKMIRDVYKRKTRAYPIDGMMFTPARAFGNRARYNKPADYFDMVVYKWKPPAQLSIDFLILKVPASMLGTKPYVPEKGKTLYILCSGISMRDSRVLNLPDIKGMREMTDGIATNGNYFPVQFSHSAYPHSYLYKDTKDDLHQKIGEFVWGKDGTSFRWHLERMRPDKTIQVKQGTTFGNNFKVAEEIFNNYLNPLSLDMMTDLKQPEHKEGQDYFLVEKTDMYKPLTKVNNFVKAQMIRQLEGKTWVVDLAAGKGQDLFTYNGFEVKNALFTDIDQAALEELGNRKWNLGNNNWYVFSRAPRTNIKIFTMQHDLFEPASVFFKKVETRGIPVPVGRVDGVVINLAIHYLMKDEKSLKNVVNLVDKLLASGGVIIFTTFDGARIHKLLEKVPKGGTWEIKQDNKVKYSIKKLYDSKSFKIGLPIGVVHPFSRGQHYEEPLADVDLIVKTFEGTGFKLQQRGSFGDWHDRFKKFNRRWYDRLTADDKKYDMLYTYVSMVKK